MITVRQIERFWMARQYDRVARLCLDMRPENSPRLIAAFSQQVPAAALAVIRLDELNQSYSPFCARMLRVILGAQETDGGWGDPLVTTICVRALMCCEGDGQALTRALGHLACLQKSNGAWPRVPIRRLPADGYVSAFILYQLGDDRRFIATVRMSDALSWFEENRASLDVETHRLWRSVALKHVAAAALSTARPSWS